jgi:predicted MFS family arabinose efflux permease
MTGNLLAETRTTGQARPSGRSLSGLDGINFLMADVRDGMGPYLSVFLKGSEHWDPGAIGVAMGASSIAAAVCQLPAGLLVDGTRAKRLLIAGSGLIVGAGCLLIVLFPHFAPVIAAQVLLGAASAIIPPAISALSLGLVGQLMLDARISRNEGFNHGGNFLAASLAGGLGQYFGYHWIFYLVCAFAVASACVVRLLDPAEIDHERARGGEDRGHAGQPIPFRDLLRNRNLMIFLASVVLFHFGNAAMLPMAGQVLATRHPGADVVALSACIIAAQLVMVGAAWAVGRATAGGFGRKTIFLVALAVLPVRGVLFSFTTSPFGVVAIQLLDGVAAGIFGVVSVLIASDLMRGTGRFNLAQGMTALAVGVGAAVSNVTAGYAVQWFGYGAGFLWLTGVASCALIFFAALMPETGRRPA